MSIVLLALREFRANWSRNAIFGLILFISIAIQLFTALSAAASSAAVQTYGTAVFGYAETHVMSFAEPLGIEELTQLNEHLDTIGQSYPWFRPATAADVPGYLRRAADSDISNGSPLTLRAVSATWRLLTPSIPDNEIWRTVTSDRRLGPALMVEESAAHRLQVTQPQAVTILFEDNAINASGASQIGSSSGATAQVDPLSPANPQASANPRDSSTETDAPTPGPSGAHQPHLQNVVRNVPIFGTYTELNKSLAVDAIVNQNLLTIAHIKAMTVQVYWRCEPVNCRDTYGLVQAASRTVGAEPGRDQRIDQLDQFQPILRQQQDDGRRFAIIVLILGAIAVAIVSTAFIEVRAPQLATLRSIGASRPAVGAITLMENLFTALIVGVSAIIIGFAATQMDPNRFNQISQIHIEHLPIPITIYSQTAILTIAIGLLTGLAPAIRAYRSVRTT